MGLRSSLKSRVKRALGRDSPAAADAPAPRPASATPAAPAAARPTPPVAAPKPAPAAPPAAAAPVSDEDAAKAAKIERARTRARKGVLKHVLAQGNAMPMGDAHNYSERRFFIAHRGFSDMMGWWLEHDYITYDQGEGVVRVTDHGRRYAESPTPK